MNKFQLCLFSLLVLANLHAASPKIGWHPSMVGELGRGLDIRNQDLLKPKVTIINEADLPPAANTGEARINVSFSQHQFDLVRSFALNTSVSVKSGLYGGKVGVEFVDNTTHSANRLNFAFECTREFGERVYPQERLTMAPEFITTVNQFKQTLRGPALERAITERYGTHFIAGHQSAAKVVILYTFSFESLALSRSLTTSVRGRYQGGFTQVGFQADVKSLLEQKDSRVTLAYRFYSTDPEQLPDFPLTAEITTFPDFLEFAAKVETYCKNMSPARAKRMAYVIEPLKNLPGYLALLDGFNPAEQFSTSYDRFLEAYAQLKAWDELLFDWTMDVRRMNWMNAQGQALVLALRRDTAHHLRGLEEKAKRHFEQGEALEVSDDLLAFFANFNRLPIPRFGVIYNANVFLNSTSGGGRVRLVAGYINCGPKHLTVENPFHLVTLLRNGSESGQSLATHRTIPEFESRVRTVANPDNRSLADSVLSSPVYPTVQNDAEQCRIIFFAEALNGAGESEWNFVIRDNEFNVVDSLWALGAPEAHCLAPLEADPESSLGIVAAPLLEQRILGQKFEQVFTITNSGPGSAYGIVLQTKLASDSHELYSITGSQGVGRLTNGLVTYEVGPLAAGASATVKLSLIPLVSGAIPAAELVQLSLGDGLLDPELADNQVQLEPMVVAPPHLTVTRPGAEVELRWRSDTARLGLEAASAIGPATGWEPVLTAVESSPGERIVREDAGEQHRFYRLRLKN